jgi:hypothetical protein
MLIFILIGWLVFEPAEFVKETLPSNTFDSYNSALYYRAGKWKLLLEKHESSTDDKLHRDTNGRHKARSTRTKKVCRCIDRCRIERRYLHKFFHLVNNNSNTMKRLVFQTEL